MNTLRRGCKGISTYHCSIHAPAWGATYTPRLPTELARVSTHAPARGATLESEGLSHFNLCFNPRTRTGCDQLREVESELISLKFQPTHPHGVRQMVPLRVQSGSSVSTHAPARGATLSLFVVCRGKLFQPTHPHGVRRYPCLLYAGENCFNPRTRTGCDSHHL